MPTYKTYYYVYELNNKNEFNDLITGPFDTYTKARKSAEQFSINWGCYKNCVIYECKPFSRGLPPKEIQFVRI